MGSKNNGISSGEEGLSSVLPALSPEDTGLFRWGVCICCYKVIYANATNADGVLGPQNDCVAGGLQPEANMMKREVAYTTL